MNKDIINYANTLIIPHKGDDIYAKGYLIIKLYFDISDRCKFQFIPVNLSNNKIINIKLK
jgi:hypothetical protein